MELDLDSIDEIRARTGVGYRRAVEALEAADGSVVRALVALEEELEQHAEEGWSANGRMWKERFNVRGGELVERLKQVLEEGNVNRVVVKQGERTVLDIPVTVGAVGAILAPYLALLGAVAALATRASIELERKPRSGAGGGSFVPGDDLAGAGTGSGAGNSAEDVSEPD